MGRKENFKKDRMLGELAKVEPAISAEVLRSLLTPLLPEQMNFFLVADTF